VVMGKKHPPIFYGWWVVGACFSIALYTAGVIFFGFTAIFEPIANEFGWSYAQISLAASLRSLGIGLLAPFLGMLVDRWGPRKLIFSGVIIIGVGLVLLSQTTSLSMFYGTFILIAVGISTCAETVLITAVANWFWRKICIATGIMTCGWGFSGLLIPVVVSLIDGFGWRIAMAFFGLGCLVIGLPLSLLIRHSPEQYGYVPDGEIGAGVIPNQGQTSAQIVEEDIGAKQALKSTTFWHITLALMGHSLMLSAVVTHVMPYLSSIGITRVMSSLVASAIPLFSISGRLGFGWAGDRLDKKRVTAGTLVPICLSMLCFEYASTLGAWLLVPFVILFGVGYGGISTMGAPLLREYFGRSRFGTILGLTMGIVQLGSVIGAPLAGWVFDNWGSYQGLWLALAGLSVAALITVATAHR